MTAPTPDRAGLAPPPVATPWDTGRGLAGYAWRAPQPRAALLLQHGLGEYAERYVGQYGGLVGHLVGLGVSVFGVDLRGHGRSPGRRAVTDVRAAVEDHRAARERLRDEGLPVVLFGHSLGGLVTAASALDAPAGLHGVVLSSPALRTGVPRALDRPALWLADRWPALPTVRLDPDDTSRLPEARRRYRADPRLHHGPVPLGLAATLVATTRTVEPRAPSWTAPTLVVHGTADRLTDPDGSRRFVDCIASPDKTLLAVEGGYHELLNDACGEAVLHALLAWLRERLP